MSDELPPGTMDLETDTPAAVEPVAAPPPPDPAVAAPAEPQEQKVVPLAALMAEREEKKQIRDRLAQVEQWAATNKPYVDFLQANPNFLTQPREAAKPQSSEPDPVDVQYARSLDLYTADGQPDIKRAQTFRSLVASEAKSVAAAEVQPMRQQTAQDQSQINFQRALQVKDGSGKTASEESLRAVWSALGPTDTANPQIAGLAAMVAFGMDNLKPKAPVIAPPSQPPVYTEASGGNVTVRPLTAFEQRMATERGKTPAQWAELAKDFQKGRTNVLED